MVGEEGRESPLVMVIAVAGVIILPADIDNGVTLLKLGRIPGTNKRRRGVCREQAKEVNS